MKFPRRLALKQRLKWTRKLPIGHFGKYHNTLCLSPQILHKHCFQFLLGLTMVPRENKNNTYAKFGGQTKSIMVFSEVAYWKSGSSMSPNPPLPLKEPSQHSTSLHTCPWTWNCKCSKLSPLQRCKMPSALHVAKYWSSGPLKVRSLICAHEKVIESADTF